MLLAAGLPLFQQGSGINTVIYYSSQVHTFCPMSASASSLGISMQQPQLTLMLSEIYPLHMLALSYKAHAPPIVIELL